MLNPKSIAPGLAFLFLLSVQATAVADVTLVRFGPTGAEKPGLIDDQGRIRDLSSHLDDITPATLSRESLDEIAAIPLTDLPLVPGDPRLGVPPTGIGNLVAIGSH